MKRLLTAAILAAIATPAFALDKIYSPNVHKGELELEYSLSHDFDSDSSKNAAQGHELEVSYGVSDRLALEIEGAFERDGEGPTVFSAVEVGGVWQFFEQGEYWLDSGLKLMYVHTPRDGDADAIEAKLLLEKQTGMLLHRLNLGVEHEVGDNSSGGFDRGAQWSTRYLYSKNFAPGFEIQSGFGSSEDGLRFNEQEHYVGPALYGRILPGLNYEAAYLLGVTSASADSAARVLIEYEMNF